MARADGSAASICVAVACSPRAGAAFEIEVHLQAAATAWDAVCASGIFERWPDLAAGELQIGIWGRAASTGTALHDGDRVELYRPLAMNPQEARRLRAGKVRAGTRR
jgi:hypothetical protein